MDEQQLVVLQEDLDQDGLLNEDMPVVYDYNDFTISTGTSLYSNEKLHY